MTSNRLPILLETIKNANVVFVAAERANSEQAYDMGAALVEAKELCKHGEWTKFLSDAGVSLRSAQRYMRVVRAGFSKDWVMKIGLTAALDLIDRSLELMPDEGTMSLIAWENDSPEDIPDILVWWSTEAFDVEFMMLNWAGDDTYRYNRPKQMKVIVFRWFFDFFTKASLFVPRCSEESIKTVLETDFNSLPPRQVLYRKDFGFSPQHRDLTLIFQLLCNAEGSFYD